MKSAKSVSCLGGSLMPKTSVSVQSQQMKSGSTTENLASKRKKLFISHIDLFQQTFFLIELLSLTLDTWPLY